MISPPYHSPGCGFVDGINFFFVAFTLKLRNFFTTILWHMCNVYYLVSNLVGMNVHVSKLFIKQAPRSLENIWAAGKTYNQGG